MVTFCISLIALVLGYLLYGRFVDSVFGPDDRATQSPLMARCLASERKGRAVFYGSMITEGLVALVWAAVSMYFFYGEPALGHHGLSGSSEE